jgi:virginiamycin A acetyltransferase
MSAARHTRACPTCEVGVLLAYLHARLREGIAGRYEGQEIDDAPCVLPDQTERSIVTTALENGSLSTGFDCHPLPASPFYYQPPVVCRATTLPNVRIGAHTYINGGLVREYTHIGRYCSIGHDVALGIGNHSIRSASTHPFATKAPLDEEWVPPRKDPKRKYTEPTEIGHDVWIGHGAIVNATLKIGIGAVIAAGAVLTKDIPPYAIVAGVPANIIGWRFDEDLRQMLLASQWWAFPLEFLSTLPTNNIPKFVKAVAAAGPVPEEEPWLVA